MHVPDNCTVVLINHPPEQGNWVHSTIVELHIVDGEAIEYTIIHCGVTNTMWVEDFSHFTEYYINRWLNDPNPMNFYGDFEIRRAYIKERRYAQT